MAAEIIIIQAPCNGCCRDTDHAVLKTHIISDREPDGQRWETRFDMIECCGCHFISLKRTIDYYTEDDSLVIEYFPPPISRRKPSWTYDFAVHLAMTTDLGLSQLLDEVYSALHANNRRLATMGARTLLDMAIVDSVGDVGTFADKLKVLQQKGFVGKNQCEFLEIALEAGNATAYRGHCPTSQQLNQVMDIVESILHQIYVLPQASAELKRSTPPRKKVAKPT
jgi:hypothetical protein